MKFKAKNGWYKFVFDVLVVCWAVRKGIEDLCQR